eukprot:5733673-Prymnesium_polylepis.1
MNRKSRRQQAHLQPIPAATSAYTCNLAGPATSEYVDCRSAPHAHLPIRATGYHSEASASLQPA